ncbi:hypothetical protein J6590_017535 [Homalodisca vitripennis]|nr:hypothetical protein J6590_017535 [Homalodisca vitripennis]
MHYIFGYRSRFTMYNGQPCNQIVMKLYSKDRFCTELRTLLRSHYSNRVFKVYYDAFHHQGVAIAIAVV